MSTAAFDVSDVSDISGANRTREPAADRTREPAADRTREPAADRTPGAAAHRPPGTTADRPPGAAAHHPPGAAAPRTPGPAPYRDEDFPGCESFHLPAVKLGSYEGRLEFWDGATETAWKVCEPTSIQHEEPSRRLVEMATWVASVRGSRIACFGSADLLRVDATGAKHWLMQADEVLYLHPDRVRLQGPAIDVDRDPLPDVALEVDHTTDVRRRKLGIYKGSGFPEVWVLVPWEASVRRPGLAIHVRRGEVYREEASSRAFPGWRSEEIFRALTESPLSAGAWRALERVALSMGAREGTKPEDNPLMGSHSAKVRTEGRAEGHREGHAEGRREGLVQGYMNAVAQVLEARGIAVVLDAAEDRALLGGLPDEAVMAAAFACTDAADFRRRLGARGAGSLRAGGRGPRTA